MLRFFGRSLNELEFLNFLPCFHLNELFSVEENRKLLPEGVIKALVDYGPPDATHAMEKHGPMANILNRAKNEKADRNEKNT